MAGLTGLGFETKPLTEILTEMEEGLRSRVSVNIDLGPESPNGQVVGIVAGQLRKLWELAGAVYSSQYPDASGFSLDGVASLTGTSRRGSTPSLVVCTVVLTAGTYAAGALIAVVDGDPLARFFNTLPVVSAGGSSSVGFESELRGPVRANSGTLTVIAQAVAGWASVTNPLDAALGREVEKDDALRIRREQEIARKGSATTDAIRVDLLDVAGVISVTVLENDTDILDANNLPPHSVEAIVRGGVSADVGRALWLTKGAGVGAGSNGGTPVTVTVTDSQGGTRPVTFTRPEVFEVFIDVELNIDPLTYGGDAAVAQALVDFGDITYGTGDAVIHSRLEAVCFTIPGVLDVLNFEIGLSVFSVNNLNLNTPLRAYADIDSSRITIATT